MRDRSCRDDTASGRIIGGYRRHQGLRFLLVVRGSLGGALSALSYPRGMPRPRVAMMFRWISLVPPPMGLVVLCM